MKKILIGLLLAVILMTLAGCSANERIRITQAGVWIDNVVLPIRQGFKLSDDAWEIREHDSGYDIVIHAVRDGI